MADRTSQPPAGTGVNARYATGTVFLFNGANSNKNEIGDVAASAGPFGNIVAGSDGTYLQMDAVEGPLEFSPVTLPTGAYTLVLLLAFPTPSTGPVVVFSAHQSGVGGVRVEIQTTGGGIYIDVVHTFAGNVPQRVLDYTSGDDSLVTLVMAYDGTVVRMYTKDAAGAVVQSSDFTIAYADPAATVVRIGDGAIGHALYGAMLRSGDVGDPECDIIVNNGWAIYAEASGGGGSDAQVVWMD